MISKGFVLALLIILTTLPPTWQYEIKVPEEVIPLAGQASASQGKNLRG